MRGDATGDDECRDGSPQRFLGEGLLHRRFLRLSDSLLPTACLGSALRHLLLLATSGQGSATERAVRLPDADSTSIQRAAFAGICAGTSA